MSAAVYRFYDATGALLYVGSSADPDAREHMHRLYSPWHAQAARRTTQWYSCRAEAFSAEKRAIRDEHPAFNRQRYTRNPSTDHTTGVRLDRTDVAEIDRMAEQEERDRSSMIRLLLNEAIAARQRKARR